MYMGDFKNIKGFKEYEARVYIDKTIFALERKEFHGLNNFELVLLKTLDDLYRLIESMTVLDLSSKFMYSDPKAGVHVINSNGDTLYLGRIEFLCNCNNPLEEKNIVSLTMGAFIGSKFICDTLEIEVK